MSRRCRTAVRAVGTAGRVEGPEAVTTIDGMMGHRVVRNTKTGGLTRSTDDRALPLQR